MPLGAAGLPSLIEAARQQSELVVWAARALQDLEAKVEALDAKIADLKRGHTTSREGGDRVPNWSEFRKSIAGSQPGAKLLGGVSEEERGPDGAFPLPAATPDIARSAGPSPETPRPPGGSHAAERRRSSRRAREAETPVIPEDPVAVSAQARSPPSEPAAQPLQGIAEAAPAVPAERGAVASAQPSEPLGPPGPSGQGALSDDALSAAEELAQAQAEALEELSEEVERKLSALAQFVEHSCQNVSSAVEDLEARVGPTATAAVQVAVEQRLTGFEERLQAVIDERIAAALTGSFAAPDGTGSGGRGGGTPSKAEERQSLAVAGPTMGRSNSMFSPSPTPRSPMARSSTQGRLSTKEAPSMFVQGNGLEGKSFLGNTTPRPNSEQGPSAQQLMQMIKQVQEDMQRRLPAVEQSLADIKEMRLQVPELRHDVDNMQQQLIDLLAAAEEAKLSEQPTAVEEDYKPPMSDTGPEPEIPEAAATPATPPSPPAPAPVPEPDGDGLDDWSEDEPPAPASPASPRSLNQAAANRNSLPRAYRPSTTGSTAGRRRQVSQEVSAPIAAPASPPASTPGYSRLGSVVGSYIQEQRRRRDSDASRHWERLEGRVDRLEEEARRGGKQGDTQFADLKHMMEVLQDRLQVMDSEFRPFTKRVEAKIEMLTLKADAQEDEDIKRGKVWNLSNQVDVIQGLVAAEMRAARQDLEGQMHSWLEEHNISPPAAARNPQLVTAQTTATEGGLALDISGKVGEIEDKVRRLQENYQQCTLKLAGLRASCRHIDLSVQQANLRVRKVADDMDHCLEVAKRQEVRTDYIVLTVFGAQHDGKDGSSTFQGTMSANDPTIKGSAAWRRASSNNAAPFGGGLKPRRTFHTNDPPVTGAQNIVVAANTLVAQQATGETPQSSPTMAAMQRVVRRISVGNQGGGLDETQEVEANTSRIARLGKKVSDLDTEVETKFKMMREELELQEQKLMQIICFLPRKQRRIVEKMVAASARGMVPEDAIDDGPEKERKDDGKKHIGFRAPLIETKHFQIREEALMPWQLVGEPDVKWSWCLQPRNEMGRDLARHFEQQEHEREEFEQEVMTQLENLREELQKRPASGGNYFGLPSRPRRASEVARIAGKESPAPIIIPDEGAAPADSSGVQPNQDNIDRIVRRLERAVIPQLQSLEERLEKALGDLRETKRIVDLDHQKKADKEDFQLLQLRLSLFEKMDPKTLEARVENLEGCEKYNKQVCSQLDEQMRRLETNCVFRVDLAKTRTELGNLKMDVHKLNNDVKDSAASSAFANKLFSGGLTELRNIVDRNFEKVSVEKVSSKEFMELFEKVRKLEHSVGDSRQIMNEGGGPELGVAVKRILLNMEDKVMILEKKFEALLEGRAVEVETASQGSPRPGPGSPSSMSPGAKTAIHSLTAELQTVGQSVQQLKHDLSVSKVDLEHLIEQGHQHMELAQRLNVMVEGAAGTGGVDEGTALSLSRVQVMIAVAARQLVAGSKWITKEVFDARIADIRKEYLGRSFTLQTQLEELEAFLGKGTVTLTSSAATLPGAAAPAGAQGGPGAAHTASKGSLMDGPRPVPLRALSAKQPMLPLPLASAREAPANADSHASLPAPAAPAAAAPGERPAEHPALDLPNIRVTSVPQKVGGGKTSLPAPAPLPRAAAGPAPPGPILLSASPRRPATQTTSSGRPAPPVWAG